MLIDVLAKNRDSLLLAEIAAFIHDLGKLSREFIAYHSTFSAELLFPHQLILHRLERGHYGEFFVDDNRKETITIPISVLRRALAETRRQYHHWKANLTENNNKERLRPKAREALKNAILHIVANQFSIPDTARRGFGFLCENGFIDIDFIPESLVYRLNNFPIRFPAPFQEQDFYLGDILERHHERPHREGIQQRLSKDNTRSNISKIVFHYIDSDSKDSGADKGKVAEELEVVNQNLGEISISTAFGYESELISVDKLKDIRYRFCNILDLLFDYLASHQGKELSPEKWHHLLYRQSGDSLGFRHEAQRAFSNALAEIRRGANDVTLWHHCFSAASLFKSLLAKAVIEHQFLMEHPDEDRKVRLEQLWRHKVTPIWHILRVNIDNLGLLSRAHRIGDILGLNQSIDELLDAVKRIVEVDYPLGNEVYRDESGIYFVFPDLSDPNEEYDIQNQVKEEISAKILALQKVEEFDVEPLIDLSGPSSFLTMIGEEIRKGYEEIANFSSANYPNWVKSWEYCQKDPEGFLQSQQEESDWCKLSCRRNDCFLHPDKEAPDGKVFSIERCPVCDVRPMCVHQEICVSCEKRRVSRLNKWLKEPERTIWLSEIADHNGRVAVIAGMFEMSSWLNGEYVESMFTNSPMQYKDYKDYPTAQAEQWLPEPTKRELNRLKDFVDDLISRYPGLGIRSDDWRQKIYTLCCKHPSPARLRRIWDTTQQFWERTVERILREYEYKDNGMRNRRIALYSPLTPSNPWESTLYVQGVRLDSCWDDESKRFIVTENLDWLAEKFDVSSIEELVNSPNWKHVEIRPPKEKEPSSVHTGEEISHNCPMEAVLLTDKYREYRPYTVIHTSPLSFIALVPCTDAMDIIKDIQGEYKKHFSKVLNRLPLSLGSIFFPKRVPLYVALDAAKRIIERFRQPMKPEIWTLVKAQKEQGSNHINLKLKKGKNTCTLRVSYQLMEKEKSDFYHPYFFLVSSSKEHPMEKRRSYLETAGRWDYPLVHVTELFPGDEIEILPSYFDFEYIDSSEKRFLLNYATGSSEHERGNRRFSKANALAGKRPYYLYEMKLLEKIWGLLAGEQGLKQNQIKNLYQTLAEKLEAWNLTWEEAAKNEVFKTFAANVLKTIDSGNWWKRLNKAEKELMLKASHNGMLFDALHLYQTVLKEKPKRD